MPISYTDWVLSGQPPSRPGNEKYTSSAMARHTALDNPPLMQGYGKRIATLRKSKGWSQAFLAERLGVEQPTVQRWEKETREPTLAKLSDLAQLFGVPMGELLSDESFVPLGPRLFVKGAVQAGAWREATEWIIEDWQTFTGRHDVTADPEHRFGLLVNGDSMDLLYPPGTILECVSVFGHTEPQPGKRVIVARMDDSGRYETTCKELVEQDGELWLVPRSHNLAHRAIRVNEVEPGIVETRIIAVVVSSVRPE